MPPPLGPSVPGIEAPTTCQPTVQASLDARPPLLPVSCSGISGTPRLHQVPKTVLFSPPPWPAGHSSGTQIPARWVQAPQAGLEPGSLPVFLPGVAQATGWQSENGITQAESFISVRGQGPACRANSWAGRGAFLEGHPPDHTWAPAPRSPSWPRTGLVSHHTHLRVHPLPSPSLSWTGRDPQCSEGQRGSLTPQPANPDGL